MSYLHENISLAQKIQTYIEQNKEFTLTELYAEFKELGHAKETLRARVYESGKVIRTSRGAYVLKSVDFECVVEQVDSKKHIFKLSNASIKYDMIYLDIPYRVGGVIGGNRTLIDYDTISPDEFKDILVEVEKCLKDENSQIFFMITGGKSSKRQADKYIHMFSETNLKLNNTATYTKLTKSGSVANMGKYPMPDELILSYSLSGKEKFENIPRESNFRCQRPPLPRSGGYRTEKPLSLMEELIKRGTRKGERILDLFSGSGKMIEGAMKLGRSIHALEISVDAIANHILPRLQKYAVPQPHTLFTV